MLSAESPQVENQPNLFQQNIFHLVDLRSSSTHDLQAEAAGIDGSKCLHVVNGHHCPNITHGQDKPQGRYKVNFSIPQRVRKKRTWNKSEVASVRE
jgi:hypothetical protein